MLINTTVTTLALEVTKVAFYQTVACITIWLAATTRDVNLYLNNSKTFMQTATEYKLMNHKSIRLWGVVYTVSRMLALTLIAFLATIYFKTVNQETVNVAAIMKNLTLQNTTLRTEYSENGWSGKIQLFQNNYVGTSQFDVIKDDLELAVVTDRAHYFRVDDTTNYWTPTSGFYYNLDGSSGAHGDSRNSSSTILPASYTYAEFADEAYNSASMGYCLQGKCIDYPSYSRYYDNIFTTQVEHDFVKTTSYAMYSMSIEGNVKLHGETTEMFRCSPTTQNRQQIYDHIRKLLPDVNITYMTSGNMNRPKKQTYLNYENSSYMKTSCVFDDREEEYITCYKMQGRLARIPKTEVYARGFNGNQVTLSSIQLNDQTSSTTEQRGVRLISYGIKVVASNEYDPQYSTFDSDIPLVSVVSKSFVVALGYSVDNYMSYSAARTGYDINTLIPLVATSVLLAIFLTIMIKSTKKTQFYDRSPAALLLSLVLSEQHSCARGTPELSLKLDYNRQSQHVFLIANSSRVMCYTEPASEINEIPLLGPEMKGFNSRQLEIWEMLEENGQEDAEPDIAIM